MARKRSLSQSMERIGRLIHSTLDFDQIMRRVISEAAQAVGSETAGLSLRQGDHWIVRYVYGFPDDMIGTRMDDHQEAHAALALETRKPVVIDDAFTDKRVNREPMRKWGVRSVLVMPLVTADEVIGVLVFNQHKAATPFTKSHVDFVHQLASSVSLAVRNACLFQTLQAELAERQKAEQEATERLQAQNRELQAQGEELQVQAEELRAQTEELTTANEGLQNQERALAAGHRKIAEVLGSIQDGFFTLDRDWRFLYVNPRAAENLGLRPDDLVGENLWERFPRILGTAHETAYRRAMETREIQRFEMRGVLTEQWYSITAYPCEEGISIYWQDIRARKQAEDDVRRSTERFRLLSETAGRLLEAGNPQEVVNELCRKVMEHLDCQVFFNFLVDSRTGRLHLNACAGIPEKEARRIEWLDYGVAVCGCVARDGQRLVAENIPTTRDPRTDLAASYGIQAYACHPLLAQGKVIGTLSFGTKTRTRFCEDDLSLMKTVADQVAVATDRLQAQEALRRAHENLQEQSAELTRANEELRTRSQELQASEQRLQMALEGGRMGRWEWDLVTDSMFWCARTYALLGLDTLRKARIETLLDCLHPDDRQAVKDLVAQALNEAQDFQAEFRVLPHRQEPRSAATWLALQAQVIRDGQEQPVRAIGVIYDITQRKQMEAELRRLNEKLEEEVQAQTDELRVSVDRLQDEVVRRVLAEGKLRKSSRLLEAFFQHTIAPLAFLDRQFNFVRVNEAYARTEGQTPGSFVRKNYFSLYTSEEDRTIFEQVVRTKEPYQTYAKLFPFSHSPQRALTYWNWRITPLLDEAGHVQFLVLNWEDVTERQKAFGELEQRAHQLQKLTLELAQAEDRERRRLAEILHDDLQQVLAAAKFHVGLLHSRVKNDVEAKELADHLGRMLREAIEKSRSLSHELSPAVLYQSDLGETFEWLGRQVHAKHGLTVHTEVHGRIDSPSEPIKAFLFRAAQEILFNAVKHAQVKEARLRLQHRRGQLWLTVADRGRGFDPRTLSQTSGFGLFSIRERAELLGGRMKIRSTKGRGSVFLITVNDGADERSGPRTQDKEWTREALAAPSSVVPRFPGDSHLRILLVDDHKIMRDGLAALIGEQTDLEVVGQAGDGRQAIELARGLEPDVVIMDVAMPTMPGDEAARQIKAILPQTRIVALSMFEEPGVSQRMLDAGAEIYLPKTGPSESLLAAIRGRE